MPSEHERPNMFAPGHRQSDIGPPGESHSQGEASQQRRSVRNPHYERWYRERHRKRAYEALTQNQIRQAVPTSAQPTTSRNTRSSEQVRRPPAANPNLLQQAQSSSKARRSTQVINGVLHAGPVAWSSAKSPLQNELTEDDGGTPEKSALQISLIPPTPPGGKTAPTNVPPRQNIQSLTVPDPNMPQPRNPQPEANTRPFAQREKESHPPSLTPRVAPSQVEVRDVLVNHRDTEPPQQDQRHDTHRPLPALPVEPTVRIVSVVHQGARTLPRGQRYYAQHLLPAPPVEPAVALRPPVVTGSNFGSMSRLGKFLWYRGGRSGGVRPVIRDSSRPVVAFGNQTVGSYVRPPGESIPPVEGLFELEAEVDVMAELEAAVVAPQERDYVGDLSVRHEGPPVLPPLLVDDDSVGLDFAPPAAEIETLAPIYELFTRERDWDFDMDVAEQYKKVCATNHSS
jgi:hypothetical protein